MSIPEAGLTAFTPRGMISIRASPLSPSNQREPLEQPVFRHLLLVLSGDRRGGNETFDNDRPKAADIINFLKFGRNPMASSFRVCNLAGRRRRVNNPQVSTGRFLPAPAPPIKAWPINGFDRQRCAIGIIPWSDTEVSTIDASTQLQSQHALFEVEDDGV
jgi:hypothetical protein